jgi:hypothetical protein
MVFVSNPFEPATLFQQQKRVARKCRSLLKFLTAQKDLFYGRQPRCRSKCVPPTSTQMPFCAETSNAEKVVVVPPKHLSAKPMRVISAALTPQVKICAISIGVIKAWCRKKISQIIMGGLINRWPN